MRISTLKKWTPDELRHAIMEADDVGAALSAIAVLCTMIDKLQNAVTQLQPNDDGIVGKAFFVEAPSYQGIAIVLSVNNDDTVNVRCDYDGDIHVVDKSHLTEYQE